MKNTLITLASVAALTGAANAQVVFSMQDATMSASNFTLDNTILPGSATSGSGSLTSIPTGGNGGSYLQVANTFTNATAEVGGVGNYWLRNGWSFDPSTLTTAEFAKLKFYGSIDRKNDPSNHVSNIILKQGGNYFGVLATSSNEANWANYSVSDIAGGITQNGGIIEMGFYSGNALAGSPGSVSYTAGYDNLSVIATVPEPSSTALLGLGGLALILRRRK